MKHGGVIQIIKFGGQVRDMTRSNSSQLWYHSFTIKNRRECMKSIAAVLLLASIPAIAQDKAKALASLRIIINNHNETILKKFNHLRDNGTKGEMRLKYLNGFKQIVSVSNSLHINPPEISIELSQTDEYLYIGKCVFKEVEKWSEEFSGHQRSEDDIPIPKKVHSTQIHTHIYGLKKDGEWVFIDGITDCNYIMYHATASGLVRGLHPKIQPQNNTIQFHCSQPSQGIMYTQGAEVIYGLDCSEFDGKIINKELQNTPVKAPKRSEK